MLRLVTVRKKAAIIGKSYNKAVCFMPIAVIFIRILQYPQKLSA